MVNLKASNFKLKKNKNMNKKLIKELQEGKCAIINNGTLEQLKEVLKEAFPEHSSSIDAFIGSSTFYFERHAHIESDTKQPDMPAYNIEDFFKEEEKPFPRVMLVSNINDIKESFPRVVIAYKRNNYIAWVNAETLEEAEKTFGTTVWSYAWEVDELPAIFPFTLKPEQAQSIIDIACVSWKEKLFKVWGKNIVLKENIIVSEEEYKEMYKACDPDQERLFDTIFK